ncbi:MAG: hypothetical protein AB1489_24595 [Acidobacteriota bacterium]
MSTAYSAPTDVNTSSGEELSEPDIDINDEELEPEISTETDKGTVASDAIPEGSQTPSLTLEEALGQLAELQEQAKASEPIQALFEQYGGSEGLQPALALYDSISDPNANPGTIREQLAASNPELFPYLVWDIVDHYKDSIVSDQVIREAVLRSDPGYQQYLDLKASGALDNLELENQLDPNNPIHRELLERRQRDAEYAKQEAERKRVQQQAKLEAQGKSYQTSAQKQIDWLKGKTTELNWGEENKDLMEDIVNLTIIKFDRDERAQAALKRYQYYNFVGDAEKAREAERIVQNYLARHFKATTQPYNNRIQQWHQGRVSTRQKQENNRLLTPNGTTSAAGAANSKLPTTGINSKDPNQLLKAYMDSARANGALKDYSGY